jgi:molecular chaperone DnaK (HSP70)
MHPSRPTYAVGIDLGTSHTVVASVALDGATGDIALLDIPQRNTAGELVAQPLLPSVRYQAAKGELGEAWQQPWPPQGADEAAPAVIGRWARDLGAAVPGRLVASAKSWLSHTGVDRTAAILPWGLARTWPRYRRWRPQAPTWPMCEQHGTKPIPKRRCTSKAWC